MARKYIIRALSGELYEVVEDGRRYGSFGWILIMGNERYVILGSDLQIPGKDHLLTLFGGRGFQARRQSLAKAVGDRLKVGGFVGTPIQYFPEAIAMALMDAPTESCESRERVRDSIGFTPQIIGVFALTHGN